MSPSAKMPDENKIAPFAVKSSDSRGRRHTEKDPAYRGIWQRDRDRIVHSTAFRRLEYKTQVFVYSAENDHFRNRLTHTIEVSQIARTAARALQLNEDLVEALSLGHDLGHGPFGHAGEDAIAEILTPPTTAEGEKPLKGRHLFDHNIQGLRVVDELEQTHVDYPGLNLTYETREGFVKNHVREGAAGRPRSEHGFAGDETATMEVQLVGHADEIAYDAHDLDDGLASGILKLDDVRNVPLYSAMEEDCLKEYPKLESDPALLRRSIVRRLIRTLVDDLLTETNRRIKEKNIQTLTDVRSHKENIVGFSQSIGKQKGQLESFLRKQFYTHDSIEENRKCWSDRLKDLFQLYLDKPRNLPADFFKRTDQEPVDRVVCDYIAGMTDRYAEKMWHELCE